MATQAEFKVYPYRWVVLAVFMAVVLVNQLAWITFAPITGVAAQLFLSIEKPTTLITKNHPPEQIEY